MTGSKSSGIDWRWASGALSLAVIAIGGMAFALGHYHPGDRIEIKQSPTDQVEGTAYIGDGVALPGFYPYSSGDSIADLVQAAGGTTGSANLSVIRIYLGDSNTRPQKININTAQAWLLQALPGIGEILANRIVEYRETNGPFANTHDLTRVSGVGEKVFENIQGLITVSDD